MIVDLLTRILDLTSVQDVEGDFEMNIKLLNGNVLDMLKTITDESVDCIVSSPPYYGLRDYSGVATYSSEDYDDLLVIANTDLQKHRDRVSESQKDRYYLTEPAFNEKDKKWYVSLKYDTSGVWGGNPGCEHEWISQQNHKDNLRFRDPNHVASVGNNKNAEIFADPTVLSGTCSKCGAWKGQLGLESSYQEYIGHLMLVMRELKRVLKKTGALFWNMGDSYASSGGASRHFGYSDPKWAKARNGSFEEPTAYDQGIKPKSLMMIPERFAMAMIDDGWVLRNKLSWIKVNAMPSSKRDGLTPKWEYVFFFTKAQKYFFDLDSIRRPLKESSIKRREYPTNTINWKNRHKDSGIRVLLEPISSNSTKRTKHDDAVQRSGSYDDPLHSHPNHPNGANPGDVIYNSKYANGEYGQTLQGFTRNHTIEKAREQSYIDAKRLYPDDTQKQKEYIKNIHDHLGNINGANPGDVIVPETVEFFRQKGQGGNFDYGGINSENGSHYNQHGVNPGDVNADESLSDLFADPNIQSAFFEYLERERPELLMSSILDIPTRSHSFAHFAVFPETLVEPFIKAGCSSEVCVKCGKPKMMEYKKEDVAEGRKILSEGDTADSLSNHYRIKWVPIGFRPSCNCNAGFEPGTVLDPFAGSGTVGVVAMKQEKNAILIEISPEYCNIIKKRLNWGRGLGVEYEHVVGEALK